MSRMSIDTVSGDSGWFTVKPVTSSCVYENIFWPIHAGGRYASTSSWSVSFSMSDTARARSINAWWVSTTPLGLPVVPEV
ncbi:hypothetical protein G6F65_020964 [Rhizopus arrhizus]|nr:hypothetical protein G6F24_017738 [Rhizopus arrhizus]KAG1245927.1 hypothetical protein G6F65_020964 [Rhizopus arrhizus]